MNKKFSLIIFTDLDGSLLHRDNFKFDEIKEYIKSLKDDGITIVPNTSKTEKEIKEFTKELGLELPFISENGSLIKLTFTPKSSGVLELSLDFSSENGLCPWHEFSDDHTIYNEEENPTTTKVFQSLNTATVIIQ